MRWCFGEFTVDLGTRQLQREGQDVHLSPKALDLLAALIDNRPNVMAKADLIDHLWPGTFVVEANLSNLIAEIRAALDDRSRTPKFVRTAHGIGYAFCGDARQETADAGAAAKVNCWIEWGRHRFPLTSGEHVIGRDLDADVRIDASTVSRRHARLLVNNDQTVLEDFGSKNGTWVRDARVTSPVPLSDGDGIRIGSLLITYHTRTAGNSTDTLTLRTR